MPISINFSGMLEDLVKTIDVGGADISRAMANGVITEMHGRIFDDGKATDGSQIGMYSSRYLRLRQKKYNRTESSKIVVSLTRKLENNFAVVEAGEFYGIGVIDQEDADKMGYVEEMKEKSIADLTDDELEIAAQGAAQALDDLLNGNN